MNKTSYITFNVERLAFALRTHVVREIVWLAELRPVPKVPKYIIGVLNYRGRIVPVMDLNIRTGQPPMRYNITNKVIIVEAEDTAYGLVVSDVQQIDVISEEDIVDIDNLNSTDVYFSDFVTAFVKRKQEVIILLDYKKLIEFKGVDIAAGADIIGAAGQMDSEDGYHIADAPEHHRELYRKRAMNLLAIKKQDYIKDSLSLAVVGINDELFGIEIDLIVEFSKVREARSIPCCPGHIVGGMNLHGDILTLVDIRGVLNMSNVSSYANAKVVVIRVYAGGQKSGQQPGNVVAGIVIDEVLDVIYPQRRDVLTPASDNTTNERYFKGTVTYEEKMLPIVDMQKLLTEGELVVNEEV